MTYTKDDLVHCSECDALYSTGHECQLTIDQKLRTLSARNGFLEDVFKNQAEYIEKCINQDLKLRIAIKALGEIECCNREPENNSAIARAALEKLK